MSEIAKADALDNEVGYSLYDVIAGRLDDPYHGEGEQWTVDYHGLVICNQGNGTYHVQLEGHAGHVMEFHPDDYEDVLELVSDLNEELIRRHDFDYLDDKEGLVEWAGKIMTSDEEKAEENPELYMKIPER